MARRTGVGGHYHHQEDVVTLVNDPMAMVGSDTETLERLFPKCRVKSLDKSPIETDSISPTVLSKSVSNMDTAPQPETCTPTSVTPGPPANQQPPSYMGNSTSRRRSHHNVMYRREYLKSSEHRRRPRPKTLDIPTSYYDSQAGYDPSPDSDEGFPDEPDCYVASNSNPKTSNPNCIREESVANATSKDQHLRHHKAHKEVLQIANPLASSQPNQDSRIEMAGGREVVSRSRAKAATKKRHVSHLGLHLVNASGVPTPSSTQQPSACQPSPSTTPVSVAGTPSSAARNRYSGEVYYEESLGRYGFHVDGNTLWGSRGLEPNFIDLDDKDDGSSGKFASPLTDSSNKSQTGGGRPLSWSGAENLVMSARPAADETPTTSIAPSTTLAGSQARTPISPTENEKDEPALSESEYTALVQMGGYLTDLYADLQNDPPPPVGHRASSNSLGLPVSCTAADTSHIEDLLLLDFTPTPQLPYQPEDKTSPCLIGGIPIAQYDGSPRRYGPRPPFSHDNARELVSCKNLADYLPHHSSNNSINSNNNKTNVQPASLPRPGFPRRVTPEDVTLSNAPVTFAPSQTRQTLEELCTLGSKQEAEDANSQITEEKLSFPADLDYILRRQFGNAYVASRLAQRNGMAGEDNGGLHDIEPVGESSNNSQCFAASIEAGELRDFPVVEPGNECDRDTASTEDLGETEVGLVVGQSRNFTLSPETTDCDSELESPPSERLSVGLNGEAEHDPPQHPPRVPGQLKPRPRAFNNSDGSTVGQPVAVADQNQLDNHRDSRRFGSMPVLEDGLSSGHNSDVEVIVGTSPSRTGPDAVSRSEDRRPIRLSNTVPARRNGTPTVTQSLRHSHTSCTPPTQNGSMSYEKASSLLGLSHQTLPSATETLMSPISPQSAPTPSRLPSRTYILPAQASSAGWRKKNYSNNNYQGPLSAKPDYQRQVEHFLRSQNIPSYTNISQTNSDVDGLDSLRSQENESPPPPPAPRSLSPAECNQNHLSQEQLHHSQSAQQLVDLGSRVASTGSSKGTVSAKSDNVAIQELRDALRQTRNRHSLKIPAAVSTTQQQSAVTDTVSASPVWIPRLGSSAGSHGDQWKSSSKANGNHEDGEDEEQKETDELLAEDEHPPDSEFFDEKDESSITGKKKGRTKEVMVHEPAVLIEGVLFRAHYLGSTQLVCEGAPTKITRMMQAEEAVSRIKALAPEGETQPSTEVDLFISTEKIMVLNTDLKEIMMDHALRTISYIADIGDLVVLMARRRVMPQDGDQGPQICPTPKMICHVFESEEAQFIAQSIGQAFQVAYMEFLKANGIEDQSFVREMDYQEVLNSQEIFGDELQMFAKKELQKEVIVPKARGEILGMVIVESGWGSMLPTVVIANLSPAGAAARCGQLNIGDQIIAINGVSLVGLPLSTCQGYIKNAKSSTAVKLTVVPCPPVVEVKIKRPDTKYQLGFSVQNGVICSLLRGGIAERGGVRVGHRIIEINGQSVVAVPHERIVGLLATSVGEIHMKTMPTSMFRLLTGQETPVYL